MADPMGVLGIARKGGNLETGEENSKAMVKSGRARLLIVASDASPGAQKRAEGYVFGCSTPLLHVPYTKEELSAASGRPGCSMAVFLDRGLAHAFAGALLETHGEAYRETAEALEKHRQRRTGKRAGKTGDRRKDV